MTKRIVVCAIGFIIHIFFLIFWITIFMTDSILSQQVLHASKVIAYINIVSVIGLFLIFGLFFRITFDKLSETPSNSKLDRLVYGGMLLAFLAVLFFEFLFAFQCNIKSYYLSEEEIMRFLHIPWLILANCVSCVACYAVYQLYHNSQS